MKWLLVLLLLFPSVAMASDKCCFMGPGDCFVISSASEMQICKNTPSTIALSSSCKESPECMLSEEPLPQPPEFNSRFFQRDATFTNVSGKANSVR